MYLPLAGAMSVSALAGGPLTTSVGSYSPVLAIGSVLAVIGTALISTLQPHSPAGQWISYQIIYGAGIGLAFQPPFLAVQTVLENPVVPAALVLLNFVQILGGIIVLSIAQNVFLAKLVSYLATAVPQLDSTTALNNGALGLVNSVSGAQRDQVLAAYSRALGDVFHISLGLSCLAVVSTLGLEWRRIRQDANKAAGSA